MTFVSAAVLEAVSKREVDTTVVMRVIEKEVLQAVMKSAKYNQSKAAKLFGVSRGTMRTKLKEHFGDEYVGTRGE